MKYADRDGEIWFDGKWVPWREATVHVLSHSLHYGMGVFEGIRSYSGLVFKLQEHLDRLWESAHTLMIRMPMSPVSNTPLVSLMYLGATFWKLFVGDTMLAAVLVEIVSRMMTSIDNTTQAVLSILPIRLIGSEIVSPTSSSDADVSRTPSPENRNMVNGSPMIWPATWLR